MSSSSTKRDRSDSTNISDDNNSEIRRLSTIINNLQEELTNNHKKLLSECYNFKDELSQLSKDMKKTYNAENFYKMKDYRHTLFLQQIKEANPNVFQFFLDILDIHPIGLFNDNNISLRCLVNIYVIFYNLKILNENATSINFDAVSTTYKGSTFFKEKTQRKYEYLYDNKTIIDKNNKVKATTDIDMNKIMIYVY
jgi:hypothetical protein